MFLVSVRVYAMVSSILRPVPPTHTLVVGNGEEQNCQGDAPEIHLLEDSIDEWERLYKIIWCICDRRHKGRDVDLHPKSLVDNGEE